MKNDEKQFLVEVYRECEKSRGIKLIFGFIPVEDTPTPREIINHPNFPIHHKRAWYLLDKWTGKGWYDWGVTLDLGWLTDEGKRKAEELIKEAVL